MARRDGGETEAAMPAEKEDKLWQTLPSVQETFFRI